MGRLQGPGEKLGTWELFEICHVFISGKRGASRVLFKGKSGFNMLTGCLL